MSDAWEIMFKMKQDDWLKECAASSELQKQLEAAKADAATWKQANELNLYAREKVIAELEAEQAKSLKLLETLKNYASYDQREKGKCPARDAILEYEGAG